jgi:hypothetical protein
MSSRAVKKLLEQNKTESHHPSETEDEETTPVFQNLFAMLNIEEDEQFIYNQDDDLTEDQMAPSSATRKTIQVNKQHIKKKKKQYKKQKNQQCRTIIDEDDKNIDYNDNSSNTIERQQIESNTSNTSNK